ncbi:MAG: FtsH protease activity modulator HflK [Candidatus Adiutrix sp.]|jgi:membrane protease subunit HflK|nr:FtsH protease activity modulator HflK [Candidatus Adiutrix sp.]
MPMDWEEWQKSRQKNKGPVGGKLPQMGDLFKSFKMPGRGRLLAVLPLAALLLWGVNGFFTVEPAEVGLVKRFGQYVRSVEPGLNYHLPTPIEEIIKVNISRTNRVEIGGNSGTNEETMMLTKDENIADIKFAVQYRVNNPQQFAFKVFNPEKAVIDAATSAMREVIGRNTIDDALTEKRQPIQEDTLQTLQAMLDKYEIGIMVQNVELLDVHVPREVSQAFRDVTSAKEDSARSVNEATGYRNEVIPQAEGQAFAIEAAANAYSAQRINLAQGEAARFRSLVAEYQKAPDITRRRLLLEAMDQVMPGAEKVLLSGELGQSLLPHLGLRPGPAAPAPNPVPAPANSAENGRR